MTNSNDINVNNGGLGFFGGLTLLFIGLKLTNYIDWSWWLVLAPLWIPITIAFAGFMIVGIFIIMKGIMKDRK